MKKQKEQVQEPVVEEEVKNDYVPVEEQGSKEIVYSHPALQDIENERQKFDKVFRLQNTFKWVVSLIAIAGIIFGCIGIPNIITDVNLANLKTGLMIGILVFSLALMLVYSVVTKRMMNKKTKSYFTFYYNKINEFVLTENGFENPVLQEPGKVDIDFFRDINLYKDVIDVRSRGLTEFEYNKMPLRIVEAAGNIKDEKRVCPVFVGKVLHGACKYLGEQTIVVYFKGNDRSLPPTNVNELKLLEDNVKYSIWSNNKDWKKVLKPAILKMFDYIETNKYLVDLAFSMHDGKIFVCFGYDDPLMVLPLQNQFNPEPNEQYKKDLVEIIKVVEALNK